MWQQDQGNGPRWLTDAAVLRTPFHSCPLPLGHRKLPLLSRPPKKSAFTCPVGTARWQATFSDTTSSFGFLDLKRTIFFEVLVIAEQRFRSRIAKEGRVHLTEFIWSAACADQPLYLRSTVGRLRQGCLAFFFFFWC